MKRSKKSVILLGMLILMFAIHGCGSESVVEKKEESQTDVSVDQTVFDEMMQALEQYEEGTAGAGLKRLNAVFGVLNFSEQYESEQEEDLRKKIADYLKKNTNVDKELLFSKLEGIEPTAQAVFSDGVESVKEELEDAGNPERYETYSKEKYEKVLSVFQDSLN